LFLQENLASNMSLSLLVGKGGMWPSLQVMPPHVIPSGGGSVRHRRSVRGIKGAESLTVYCFFL
jgi:hypothetical protein